MLVGCVGRHRIGLAVYTRPPMRSNPHLRYSTRRRFFVLRTHKKERERERERERRAANQSALLVWVALLLCRARHPYSALRIVVGYCRCCRARSSIMLEATSQQHNYRQKPSKAHDCSVACYATPRYTTAPPPPTSCRSGSGTTFRCNRSTRRPGPVSGGSPQRACRRPPAAG